MPDIKHGTIVGRRTHGIPSEYTTYFGMIARCCNPNPARYADYGGRGITVCQRWRSFKNFIEDMGPKPTLSHTIERENNDLGYGQKTASGRHGRCNAGIPGGTNSSSSRAFGQLSRSGKTGIRQGLISERLRRGLCAVGSECSEFETTRRKRGFHQEDGLMARPRKSTREINFVDRLLRRLATRDTGIYAGHPPVDPPADRAPHAART